MKTPTKPFTVNNPTLFLLRFIAFMLLVLLTLSTFAQQGGEPQRSGSPYFFVISDNPALDQLPLKSTRAEVTIAGVIADVAVIQEYRNEGIRPLEAVYTFPASTQAAVYALEMAVGDRKIVAKIEEREKARQQYTQAKAEGKRTSLLEQQRPNLFQMNVANIMPGDVITVTLRYTELLMPEAGTYKFVYPTVAGPRYSGEGAVARNTALSVPFMHVGEEPPYKFNIAVNLSMGMPIQHLASTTHQVTTTHPTTGSAAVALAPIEMNGGNRDFVLEYKLAGSAIESGLMLYEHGDENFFLLMVQPPKRVVKEQIPPREYIFIVDVSGSMHGFPINTAKTLMRNLIVGLKPTDRFNVLVFESGAHWLANESLPAVEANIGKAHSFLDKQVGGGGTNLMAAMSTAMSFPRHAEALSRSFVVITDGYVDVERGVFDMIRQKSDKANVFAFGIGSSVNHYVIEGIAHVGMSEPFTVLNPEQADLEAEKFRKYINSPVLTQVRRKFTGFEVYDVEPITVPDVLADRPVIIYGKYRRKAQGEITLEGYAGTRKYTKTFDVSKVKPDPKNSALRYLWARKKIQMLDDYKNLGYGGEEQQEVTKLGLRYNLMTAYTSFVAIEENLVANADKDLTTVKQPLPLPQGVENSAVGFEAGIDEDEVPFTFHKKVVLPPTFEAETRKAAAADIESRLMPEIGKYIAHHGVVLDVIEVTVDAQGKVIRMQVSGPHLTQAHQEALRKIIAKYTCTSAGINGAWKFKVVF
jgi:Ca-activated chloride channel family protein